MKKNLLSVFASLLMTLFVFIASVLFYNSFLSNKNTIWSYNTALKTAEHSNYSVVAYSKDQDKTDIVWRNVGFVGYELSSKYASPESKAIFVSNGSANSFYFNNDDYDLCSTIISVSENTILSNYNSVCDYLNLDFINEILGSKTKINEQGYCYITEQTADKLISDYSLENYNDLLKDDFYFSINLKNPIESRKVRIGGILSASSSKIYSDVYGSFIILNRKDMALMCKNCGIGLFFSKNITAQNIEYLYKYFDKLLLQNDENELFEYSEAIMNPIVLSNGGIQKHFLLPFFLSIILLGCSLILYFLVYNNKDCFASSIFVYAILLIASYFCSTSLFKKFNLIFDYSSIFVISIVALIIIIVIYSLIKKPKKLEITI